MIPNRAKVVFSSNLLFECRFARRSTAINSFNFKERELLVLRIIFFTKHLVSCVVYRRLFISLCVSLKPQISHVNLSNSVITSFEIISDEPSDANAV